MQICPSSHASEFDDICGACYMKQSVRASGDKMSLADKLR